MWGKHILSNSNSIRLLKHVHMHTDTHMCTATWDCTWANTCADTCINTKRYNKSQTWANRVVAGDTGYSYPSEWEVTAQVFFPLFFFFLNCNTGRASVCVILSAGAGGSINIRLALVLFSIASSLARAFSQLNKVGMQVIQALRKHNSWHFASASNLWLVTLNMWGNIGGRPFETICPTKWCLCQALWAFCWALKLPRTAELYIFSPLIVTEELKTRCASYLTNLWQILVKHLKMD